MFRRSFIVLSSKIFDLRSDTVTRPCAGMREAMKNAIVGDDVFQDDPTVLALEEKVAKLAGKEAGIFVPTGTMSNLIAVGLHCSRGDEVILGGSSHIFCHEAGGSSAHMGVAFHTVKNSPDGTLPIAAVKDAIRPQGNVHFPKTKLVCLENTHNLCGGRAISSKYVAKLAALCRKNDLKLHVDGARLWNAAIALRVDPSELLKGTSSASMCLSKGLGAPVGSVLVGDSEFISRARFLRKSLGGGMRQSGVLAAAGIFALDNNLDKMVIDHEKAKHLATLLSQSKRIVVDPAGIETNIVYFDLTSEVKRPAHEICAVLRTSSSVLLGSVTDKRLRAVTHLDLDAEDIPQIAKSIINEIEK